MRNLLLLLFIFSFSFSVSAQEAAQIKNSKASIHSNRDIDSKTIKWVGYGDRIIISAEPIGEWYKVYLPNNQIGWILIDDVEFLPNTSYIKQCETTIQNLPTIRGLKLGMSKQDLLKAYPSFETPRPFSTPRKIILDPIIDISVTLEAFSFFGEQIPESYRDSVFGIIVRFSEDKLADFTISYDTSVQWVSYDEFITKLNSLYNFPKMVWGGSKANCGNYQISVSVNPNSENIGSSVTFYKSDDFIRYELKKSREAKQQKFKL